MQIFEFSETESTNLEARKLYKEGTQAPFWTRADKQSAGKGRRGREWTSKAGNLYASAVYPWTGDMAEAAKLSFVAALAVCRTLDAYDLTSPPQLKWPNDVLIRGEKISGILLENIGEAVIVGIGINLMSHPEGTEYPATNLLEHISPEALNDAETIFTGAAIMLPLLAKEFDDGVKQFIAQGFAPIRAQWLERARGIGGEVVVRLADETFTGQAVDLLENGALRVALANDTIRDVHAGDVFFPRKD